nr:hypothetical protein [Tanacetum cinerariifolium]
DRTFNIYLVLLIHEVARPEPNIPLRANLGVLQVEVVTTAKFITEVVTAAVTQGSAASATIPVIKMDAKYARKLQEEIDRDHDGFSKDINWDAAMDHVNQKSSNPQYIEIYQEMKKRP